MDEALDRAKRQVYEWRLGQTSARYESSDLGPATISTGRGDHGGVSYGSYQLSYQSGTLREYLDQSKYGPQFQGLEPATAAFNSKWKELANNDPKFAQDQHDFIGRSHFDVQVAALRNRGLDFTDRGRAVQDALWSTSVQFRHHTPRIFEAGLRERFGASFELSELSDRDIVTAVQDYKITHNDSLFKSSPRLWDSLLRRAHAEKESLTGLADSEALVALSGQHRDWNLGPFQPATSAAQDPMEHYRSNLRHIQEGNFAALGTNDLQVLPPQKQAQSHKTETSSDIAPHTREQKTVAERQQRDESTHSAYALQERLNEIGITDGHGHKLAVDGIYGRSTREAVENFQLWHGLETSGVADRATLERLRNSPSSTADAQRQPVAPTDPGHPDHAMLEQIRNGVRAQEGKVGKPYDEASERISRCLLAACKDNREMWPDGSRASLGANALNRVDHVVIGNKGHIFVVEGRLDDPAHKLASVPVTLAMRTPVEQSDEKLHAANQAIAQERATAQQAELMQGLQEPGRGAPVMQR